jgi:hypothetical protein
MRFFKNSIFFRVSDNFRSGHHVARRSFSATRTVKPSCPEALFRWMLRFAIVLIAAGVPALKASAAINIDCTSGNQFYIDANANLLGRYVSYQITNTGPEAYDNIWVEIGNFTGGVVSLAPNETNLYSIDSLPVGSTKTAFFYIQAGSVTSTPQSHTISVYNGQPPSGTLLASSIFTFSSVGPSISAASNKIVTISWAPMPPTLGGMLTLTVDGECGTIGNNGQMIFSPAGFPDWLASTYKLMSTEVTLGGGVNAYLRDRLYYVASAQRNVSYHAVYTFRMIDIAPGPIYASPVATISSGARMKHDNVNLYDIIDPIVPAANLVTLAKAVFPSTISGGDTATYTITLLNSGFSATQVDSIMDFLPSTPAAPLFLAGSSRFNSMPHPDPTIFGTRLKWTGPFAIDSGGTANLTFDAIFPATEGAYTNLALAAIGNVLIDTTLDIGDVCPAAAVIIVGMPHIIMLKSTQVSSDPVNNSNNPKAIPGARILYTITITNQGMGMADEHSMAAGDMIPAGASLFLGDINGAGSGPVIFEDGIPASGLTYSYAGLSDTTDNLAFSSDSGATYSYIPLPDSSGFDSNITNILINPDGSFQGAVVGGYPNFTIKFLIGLR